MKCHFNSSSQEADQQKVEHLIDSVARKGRKKPGRPEEAQEEQVESRTNAKISPQYNQCVKKKGRNKKFKSVKYIIEYCKV